MNQIPYVGPRDLAGMQIRGDVNHKGHSGGRVLVIGGGGPYAGPPALSALAAYRAGADLVYVAAPRRIADIISSFSPNLIVWPMSQRDTFVEDDLELLKPLIEYVRVVVIGMGIEITPHTAALIKAIAPLCERIVMDAGALMPEYPLKGILTPHHNEFRRISGKGTTGDPEANAALAKSFAAERGVVTVIKGPVDVVADSGRIAFNRTGNPGMTVTGTGDVMAGIIGSLYCKNPAFEAACCGTFVAGAAGNLAFEEAGFGMTASDVVDMIPYVLKAHHPAYAKQLQNNSRF
jgi:yjeF C-terminal region, hydroxyethylthiazole kinase-related